MINEEIKQKQEEERIACLEEIINNLDHPKKIIVAGPGTGKTFTFGSIINDRKDKKILVLTFINKLVNEMKDKFGDKADVRTFHSYCKKLLHKRNKHVDIFPRLNSIIREDAEILDKNIDIKNIDKKFQGLAEETDKDIKFYLERGDYYNSFSFTDSIYRLYNLLVSGEGDLGEYDYVIVDEFQDFNLLEVSLLEEIEKSCNFLIAGDDDQAVYDTRYSDRKYIIDKYNDPNFKNFELPFCGRCTYVIVETIREIIKKAKSLGFLDDRIEKRYECYLPDKCRDSETYRKIDHVTMQTAVTIPKYIHKEIKDIVANHQEDIDDSHKEGSEYPTVLVIGSGHYLKIVEDYLKKYYKNINSVTGSENNNTLNPLDAYNLLIEDKNSNLGWRILIEIFSDSKESIIEKTKDMEEDLVNLIENDFKENHLKAVDILKEYKKDNSIDTSFIRDLLGEDFANEILVELEKDEEKDKVEIDKSEPSIYLATFQGAKGLSGGHIFILNMNDDELPGKKCTNVKVSQFLVALTRTRKKCHLISNYWFRGAVDKKGVFLEKKKNSRFVEWVPKKYLNNRGNMGSKDFKKL